MSIQWYGERGIINSLVTQLSASGVEAGIAFLKCIQWGDGQSKDWLLRVTSITYIVEVGLSDFGNPDLIIVCTSKDSTGSVRRHIIFVEAKVVTYQESFEKGGPSSINRQLTLKYRFAQALQAWKGQLRPIAESNSWHAAYYRSDESASVREENPLPRQIAKRSVIQICLSAQLQGVPIDDIYFVAWTWDRESFFADGWDKFIASKGRPMFMDLEGNEILSRFAHQVGWLGYQHIHQSTVLKNVLDHTYHAAFASMRPSLMPEVKVGPELSMPPRMLTRNIRFLKNEQVKSQIEALTANALAVFGPENVTVWGGSISVTLFYEGLGCRKVLIKLLPQGHGESDEKNLLGISTSLGQKTWGDMASTELRSIGSTEQSLQPFFMFPVPPGREGEVFARAVFDQVAELLFAQDGDQES